METKERKAKIKTYLIALHNGDIRNNQLEALDFIHRNPGTTIHEMRKELAIAHQSLTPVVSMLMDVGIIKEVGQEKIKDSHYSKFAFVHEAEEQDRLAAERKKDKFTQWMAMGRKEFGDLMSFELLKELGGAGTWSNL